MGDKWQLLKPMVPRYMAPLCKCLSDVYTFGQIAHGRAHLVFVYLVSSSSSVQHFLFSSREVRIHHQSRRCAHTCIPCPYVRVIPGFWAHCSFHSGLLSSLAGALSSSLLTAFFNPPWLACVSKYCISLSFIPHPRAAGSSNARNSNTLNHSRTPSNCTFVGISVWVFPRIPGSGPCISPYKHRRNMWGPFIVGVYLSFSETPSGSLSTA